VAFSPINPPWGTSRPHLCTQHSIIGEFSFVSSVTNKFEDKNYITYEIVDRFESIEII